MFELEYVKFASVYLDLNITRKCSVNQHTLSLLFKARKGDRILKRHRCRCRPPRVTPSLQERPYDTCHLAPIPRDVQRGFLYFSANLIRSYYILHRTTSLYTMLVILDFSTRKRSI